MKRMRPGMLAVVMFVCLFVAVSAVSWAQQGQLKLSGVTVADAHPNGCIDCHKDLGGGKDYRLSTGLKEIKGHPDITKIVNKVPDGCLNCHKEGSKAGPLNLQTHKIHFQKPAENVFVTNYGGDCLNCHKIDLATGTMTVKSGAKNW